MQHDAESAPLIQAIARPGLIPLRWARSQKLIGYYDAERGELVYQDARGREIDRALLTTPHLRERPAD